MKKIFLIFGIVLLFALGFVVFASQTQKSMSDPNINVQTLVKPISYKASFAIFTNGTYRIFDDPKYHYQSEDVYMEKANIIVVEKPGVTWSYFFNTLPMNLKKDCIITGTKQTFCTNETERLKFYINGVEDPNALNKEIRKLDKLLVSFGSETEEQTREQFKQIPAP